MGGQRGAAAAPGATRSFPGPRGGGGGGGGKHAASGRKKP